MLYKILASYDPSIAYGIYNVDVVIHVFQPSIPMIELLFHVIDMGLACVMRSQMVWVQWDILERGI